MDRRIIVVIVVVAITVSAGLLYVSLTKNGEELLISVENVGGKYNATISFREDYTKIGYTDEDEEHSEMYFKIEMRDGLDWIKTNTPENTTFLCWWDYGHMIKDYSERDVVVRNPSEETKECVRDPSSITEFDPHERILDVATALTTNDFNETLQIPEKYSVTHVLVCTEDSQKTVWFYRIAGLEETDYAVPQDSSLVFTDVRVRTMITKFLENRNTDFTFGYKDEEIKVYNMD